MKGDTISVIIATGGGATTADTVTASKAGRRVQTKVHRQWTIVEEVTRNGKPTGTSLKVLTSALLLLVEKRGEAPNQPAKATRGFRQGTDGKWRRKPDTLAEAAAELTPSIATGGSTL